MDKDEFVYSVNGLRVAAGTGKALYRCRSKVGQKSPMLQNGAFCTLHPVDMQRLFHKRAVFQLFFVCQDGAGRVDGPGGCPHGQAMRLPLAVADSLFCRQAMQADGGIGRQSSAAVSMVSRCVHRAFASSMEKFVQSHSCRRFFFCVHGVACASCLVGGARAVRARAQRALFFAERLEVFHIS